MFVEETINKIQGFQVTTNGLNSPHLASDAVAADLTDKPVLYWANPLDLDIQWCVKECPSETKALPGIKF
jgi:hypothetical protein